MSLPNGVGAQAPEQFRAVPAEDVTPDGRFMLYLLILYILFFILRPFEYWRELGSLHIERIYALFLLAALAAWPRKRWLRNPLNVAVGLFFVVIVLSAATSLDRAAGFRTAFDYLKTLVLFVVMVAVLQREDDLRLFIRAYIVIMALYVGWSTWEFFVNDRHWYRMGIRRLRGVDELYGDPNYFAASVAYSLPFLWSALKAKSSPQWFRILLYGYGMLAVVAIIYTGSRSGMVTCLFFLGLVWLDSSRKVLGFLVLLVVVSGLWLRMPDSYKDRFVSTFTAVFAGERRLSSAEASAHGRIAGLVMGYKTFLEHPVLGIGPGNFKYSWAGGTGDVAGGSAHNLYGQLIGELGGMGAIAFGAMLWLTFRCHNRVRRRARVFFQKSSSAIQARGGENVLFLRHNSVACMQALALLLFNGNFGHNLFRFNYLWIVAFAIISADLIDHADGLEERPGRSHE